MYNLFKAYFLISIMFFSCTNNKKDKSISFKTPDGMVWVQGKSYTKGAKKRGQLCNDEGKALTRSVC